MSSKIKCAVSYLTDEKLQWWELSTINNTVYIISFDQFSEEILKYFEPISKIPNARKAINALKQMGAFNSIPAYNKEFSKCLLQVPAMAVEEQIFHYSQGLKNRITVEIERSEINTLPQPKRIADRMESLCNNYRAPITFSSGPDSGPVPM